MIKFFWIFRALLYKFLFKKFKMPSYIGKPTYLKGINKVSVGEKVRIYPGIRLEVLTPKSSIEIEDNVSIGQNLTVISSGYKGVTIKRNSTLSANIFITDVDHTYTNLNEHIMDQPLICKETVIGENNFIGYGAVIQAGTVLGTHCIVGSNAVVKGIFPDYSVIAGVPARIIKRYDFETRTWRKTDKDGKFN